MRSSTVVAAAIAALLPSLGLACSSCPCTLDSDWSSQGYTVATGFHLDARFDYSDQSELRSGTGRFDTSSAALPAAREYQQQTVNRNLVLGLDYAPTRAWGVNLRVPYLDRSHATIAAGDSEVSEARSRGLGDLQLLVRYQGFGDDARLGVQFGLKLPSGSFNERFRSGPQAGQVVDRGLQPGTGTTDLVLGLYTAGWMGSAFGYFASALVQQPLDSRAGFRPGTGVTFSTGLRYLPRTLAVTPQLQLNVRIEGRERGPNADVANSGATFAYLSPGIGLSLRRGLDAFAFVQLPVYQNVNGLQLEPKMLGSLGLRYRF
jgi:hypothetical protein